MHLIFLPGFWFVHKPFGCMVRIQSFPQFTADHLSHPVSNSFSASYLHLLSMSLIVSSFFYHMHFRLVGLSSPSVPTLYLKDPQIEDIGPAVRVFANGPGDLGSIPGRVIPKTLKMELDTTLLNTQHYKVRFKGKVEQSREWSSALPYTLV